MLETPPFQLTGHNPAEEAIIFQGNILTPADDKILPCRGNIASILGDTIIATGSFTNVQRVAGIHAPVQVLTEGQVIVPGLFDPHLHLLFTGLVSNPEST